MSDDIVSLTNHLNQCLMSGIDVHKRRKSLFFSLCVRGTLGFMDSALHNQYELTTGKATRIYMTPKSATELRDFCTIDGEEVFSYGYVRSSNRPANFSYTVMPSC